MTTRSKPLLTQTEMERMFPSRNEKWIRRIPPRDLGTNSYRVQGCKQKGMEVHVTYRRDSQGDRWISCYASTRKKAVSNEDISFLIDNFIGYELDVIQLFAGGGKKTDITKEVYLYANIDNRNVFGFESEGVVDAKRDN